MPSLWSIIYFFYRDKDPLPLIAICLLLSRFIWKLNGSCLSILNYFYQNRMTILKSEWQCYLNDSGLSVPNSEKCRKNWDGVQFHSFCLRFQWIVHDLITLNFKFIFFRYLKQTGWWLQGASRKIVTSHNMDSKKYCNHIQLIYAWSVLYQLATKWYIEIIFTIDHGCKH
jgi:hypothetical protein